MSPYRVRSTPTSASSSIPIPKSSCLREVLDHFVHGTHHHDPILSHQLGDNAYYLPKLEEYSHEKALRALQLFEKISHHLTFDFKADLVLNEVKCWDIARCESKMLKSTHQYLSTEETIHGVEWEKLLKSCASDDNFDPIVVHTRTHLCMDFFSYA